MKDSIELAAEVRYLRDDLEAAKEELSGAREGYRMLQGRNAELEGLNAKLERELSTAKERADRAEAQRNSWENVANGREKRADALQVEVASLKAEVARLTELDAENQNVVTALVCLMNGNRQREIRSIREAIAEKKAQLEFANRTEHQHGKYNAYLEALAIIDSKRKEIV